MADNNEADDSLKAFQKAYDDYEAAYKEALITNGTKAFIQGDLKAQKALNLKLKFNLVNKEALKYIKEYKKELAAGGSTIQGKFIPWLDDKSKEERSAISKILEEGYKAGKATGVRELKRGGYPKNSIAADLQQYFNSRKSHAALVARTEIARIQSHGSINRYHKQGVSKIMWLVFNPCPICEQYARRVYDIDKMPREIPAHPNCFLPGTLYEAPGVVAGLRAFYSGQAVKLTLTNGASVAITENHLILTAAGFARANQLRKGDYIVYSPGFEREVPYNPNNNEMIPRVEDIFDTLIKTSSGAAVSMEPAPEYLHGDGQAIKGNIDVIRPYGFLGSTGEAPSFKHTYTDFFYSGGPAGGFITSGALAEVLKGLAGATDGGMSSGRKPAPFFGRRISHTGEHSLGPAPASNPGGIEPAVYGSAATIKNLRELVNRYPGIIELQEITEINIFEYHGPVYDFETISTLSIGNGFITSNCRCALAPVPDDVPTGPAPNQKIPEVFEKEAKAIPPKHSSPEEIRKQFKLSEARKIEEYKKKIDEIQANIEPLQIEYDRLRDEFGNLKRAGLMTREKAKELSAAWDPLLEQINGLEDAKTQWYIKKYVAEKGDNTALKEMLYINDGTPSGMYRLYMGFDLPEPQAGYAEKAEEFLNKVASQKIRDSTGRLPIEIVDGRSWTSPDNIIRLGKNRDEATLIHETGHNFEYENPGFKKAAQDYLKRRTEGEQSQKLSDVTGLDYDDWEMTKKDNFINPYMGKEYSNGSTEVISMGLEYLYENPAMLAEKDPELFDIIVNGIRGAYDS